MPTFNVIVTRDTTESTTVTVDALDRSEAGEQAINIATDATSPLAWEVDDNPAQDAYVTDISEVPEYVVMFLPDSDTYAVRHATTETIVDGSFDDFENAQMWADFLNSGES